MNSSEVLTDGFGRVAEIVRSTLRNATSDELTFRPDPEANTVAWLIWHIARVQDAQIADVANDEDVWIAGGWVEKFQLPFERRATGYGMSAADVAKVPGDVGLLGDYFEAVHQKSIEYLGGLGDDDLDRVVDEAWNPPVTLGVRLISVLNDVAQHVGQASYVKGLAGRAG